MDLLKAFQQHIKSHDLFKSKDKLLLAVSGGVDSVVLCELCHQAGYRFVIAHCNFMLRIPESHRDEFFVRELNKKYGAEVYARHFPTEEYAADKKISIQEAAREIRYAYFDLLIREGFADLVLTAHHADDNIETVMMNFFRGTGPQGLGGIPEKINTIRRPLLPFRKEQLMDFAKENKLEYVEDSSNSSSKYTRNYFRNELIPSLEKVYPEVKNNLLNNIKRFRSIGELYQSMVDERIDKLGKKKGNEIHFPVKQLEAFNNRSLYYEIISKYGFSPNQLDEFIKLFDSDSGKYIQAKSGLYQIIRHRHWLIVSPVSTKLAEHIIIEKEAKDVEFAEGKLHFSTAPTDAAEIGNVSGWASSILGALDAKEIQYPLVLRPWKDGDYFYPMGLGKKKKVARFLIDAKLSKVEKDRIWVLESNKKIIWVIGHRIDDRFKLTANTRAILKIKFTKAS